MGMKTPEARVRHDEILSEVVSMGTDYTFLDLIDIIGSIMNIHKPGGYGLCASCRGVSYPCPTIQAIESHLR